MDNQEVKCHRSHTHNVSLYIYLLLFPQTTVSKIKMSNEKIFTLYMRSLYLWQILSCLLNSVICTHTLPASQKSHHQ